MLLLNQVVNHIVCVVNVQQKSILYYMLQQQTAPTSSSVPRGQHVLCCLLHILQHFEVWPVSRYTVHAKPLIWCSESYSNKKITEIEMQTSFTVSYTKHLLKWREKGRCEEDSRDDGKSTSMLLLTFISHQKASRLCKQIPKSLHSLSSFLPLWPGHPACNSAHRTWQ